MEKHTSIDKKLNRSILSNSAWRQLVKPWSRSEIYSKPTQMITLENNFFAKFIQEILQSKSKNSKRFKKWALVKYLNRYSR